MGRLLIKYRKQEVELDESESRTTNGEELSPSRLKAAKEKKAFRAEREDVADQFYERARYLMICSDVGRLQVKCDFRKHLMKDFKDRYEKASQELLELKFQINVRSSVAYLKVANRRLRKYEAASGGPGLCSELTHEA